MQTHIVRGGTRGLQVTDIADAMVIRRIFSHLFANGMVVVATSNRPPCDLYLHGLQRESFLPFIDEVYEHLEVHNVDDGIDHRLGGTEGGQTTYYISSAAGPEIAGLDVLWNQVRHPPTLNPCCTPPHAHLSTLGHPSESCALLRQKLLRSSSALVLS